MNAPHAAEHIVLSADELKLTYEEDSHMPNAGTFVILKEDHTLGNILRMQLLRDKRVLFAGYRMPHPLEPRLVIKVRTTPDTNPTAVLTQAIANTRQELTTLEKNFMSQAAVKRNPDQQVYMEE